MKEIWKEIATKNKLTYYVSNYGRVKCEDEILSIGHGMYMLGDNPCIISVKYPYRNLWRTVYALFGDIKLTPQLQIHHIDYNHLNNHINNLIPLTCREHGNIHNNDSRNGMLAVLNQYHDIYEEHNKHKEEYRKEWHKIKQNILKRKQQQKQQEKEKLNKIKRQKYKQKLYNIIVSGDFTMRHNKNGNIIVYKRPEYYDNMPKEHLNKRSTSLKKYYETNYAPNKKKICVNKDNHNKYIYEDELQTYINDGWKQGQWQGNQYTKT